MNSSRWDGTDITRRDFMYNLTVLGALASLPTVLTTLSGCASASLPTVRMFPEGNLIRISLTAMPVLSQPGGAVMLSLPRKKELVIVHWSNDEYVALSPTCTHRGCRVRKVQQGFECPCHGSRYDQYGEVIEGPATRPLARYPLQTQGDQLLLQYQSLP